MKSSRKKNTALHWVQLLTIACLAATMPLSLFAKEASRDSFSLSGSDWWVHADAAGRGVEQAVFSATVPATGWIPAQVPGNIQADVEAAHLLRPLWYGGIDTNLYEVARKDWWYRKDFFVPASYAGKRLTLMFDGVDERCQVWLNGQKIGANAGMFRCFDFDVSRAALAGKTNRLAVWIARMPEELVPYLIDSDAGLSAIGKPHYFLNGLNLTRQKLKDLKTPGNFSYDWSVNVWTLGIWKEVRLEATGPARIKWMRVQTALTNNCTRATVSATLEIDGLADLAVEADFRVSGHGTWASREVKASLKEGDNLVAAELPIDQPALWWPNGQGEQPLYTIEAEIKLAGGGSVSDAHSTRFGIRELRWVHTEGAPTNFISRYQLVVNGRPVRTMGSGVILPYILPGCGLPHELQMLRLAKEAGMNTLRINGGGGAPLLDEPWYDLADELGILISYEFPIGNCSPETDAVFLTNLEATCRSMIKQSRNHPSIMEYVGGNEMDWNSTTRHPALQVMQKVAAEENDRLFRATCPDVGAKHSPWDFDIRSSYGHYNRVETMRYGEFGTASPAHLEAWYRDIPLKSQWPINPRDSVLIRKNAIYGAFGADDWLFKPRIDWAFGSPDNLPDLIRAGQYLGAEGLRYAFDAFRRKGKRIGGFSNHCYSEPWPNAAGSYMVDFNGRTLINYDFVRQALVPISLSLRYDSVLYAASDGIKAVLFMVSDAPAAVTGLRWNWLARDQNGNVFTHGGGTAGIQPREVKSLTPLALQPVGDAAKGLVFVEMRLEDHSGKLLTERVQIFGPAIGRFAGLLKNEAKLVHAPLELPDGPDNLAYVGNGAKPATASSCRPEPYHQPRGLNDGKYGNGNSWIGAEPRSSFQIDLGKPAQLGRFKLGRDRTGELSDRAADYLKIETSVDGRQWDPVFEQAGLSMLKGFGPEKTLVLQVIPVRAQFVKVAVEPSKSAPASEFACVDEFEVYAPANTQPVALPCVAFENSGWADPAHAVRRTSLTVVAAPPGFEGDQEVCALTVKNTGPMTALFCEPHPLLVYRTDLFIDNNNCFIPPGESRVITIRAPRQSESGLSLAQTGWRVACWNADDLIVEPSAEVLLAVGRWDKLSREFKGYFDVSQVKDGAETVCTGTRPDTAGTPYRMAGASAVRFEFDCASALARRPSRLRIHTADQSEDTPTIIEIAINGRTMEKALPKGLGIQRTEPAHLAFPVTIEFDLPATSLRSGKNSLTVRVKGGGWFAWDALDLVGKRGL